MYQFLSLLPAMLAIVGFIAFLLLRGRILDDQIVRDIVAKLRNNSAIDPSVYAQMTPARLKATLEADRALRTRVGKEDFELLKQIVRQQFLIRVIVYGVLSAIFFFGVGLYAYQTTRPKKLFIGSIGLASTAVQAKGTAVDLDPLQVSWTPDGPAEDVRVVLVNPRTNQKTEPQRVSSAEGKIVLSPDLYRPLLVERKMGDSNRIRVMIEADDGAFPSPEIDVYVGIKIMVAVFPDKITVASLIDDRLTPDHDFEVQLLFPSKRPDAEPTSLKGEVVGGKHDFKQAPPRNVDWDRAKVIYLGRSDARLIRQEFLVDDEVKRDR